MNGVVSLLDPDATARIHDLWAEMEAGHGIAAAARQVPWPHLSYHIAIRYDMPALETNLRALARAAERIQIMTTGLGVFTGPMPVLYLAVTRSPALSALHARAWAVGEATSEGASPLYRPEAWVPHITLAHLDVTPANLPGLIADLGGRDFAWTITLDSFSAGIETDGVYVRAFDAPLGPA